MSRRFLSLLALVFASALFAVQAHAQSAAAAPELRVFDATLIDKSVDPCENFYQFACSGWLKRNPLPADKTSYGRYEELYELNRSHLHDLLEQASAPAESRTPNQQKVGDEYASCMDTAAIEKAGLKPVQPELDRIAALKSKSDLPALVGHLQTIGVNAFFHASADQDYSDASSVIVAYNAGGLGLPERGFYTRADARSVELRHQYVEHVRNLFQLAGEQPEQAQKDAEAVLALETRLATASLTNVERREPKNLNNPTDVMSFGKTQTNFSIAEYAEATHSPATGKMNDEQPKFFAEFNTLIGDTPLDQIKTYLRWQLLHAFAGTSAPAAFDKESWNFYAHILNGAESMEDRWKRCTSRVDREMGEALGQVYVEKYFPPEAKEHAVEMTLAVEQAMDKDIDNLDWMSAETKVRAKEKLHAVMNKVGYPDKWRDYSKLEIIRGDALGNQSRVREFNFARQMAKIGKPVDKNEWYMSPPTVNAYYDPQQNNVNFPAGYFQPPFFSDKEDDAANYGDMGSTIGHELTHGFDDEGRQFDKDGNLKDWWTKDDGEKFNARAECMVKQYDAIEAVPGVHLNGKLTLGENLADLGGLWLAWMAWQEKAAAAHVDMDAKTEGYTADQRFWIAYTQQWCTQTRPEQLRTQAQTDSHAPEEYRANTILSDLPEFAKSFNCKKAAKMVAAEQCRIW
ncbi:MAG TPA: M13 family metallopeptidase [Terracidiphilus sp.]